MEFPIILAAMARDSSSRGGLIRSLPKLCQKRRTKNRNCKDSEPWTDYTKHLILVWPTRFIIDSHQSSCNHWVATRASLLFLT